MEEFSLPCLKKRESFGSGSETKIKKKKSVEIRVFHPPLCLFQSTWAPEPMQETAWSSGGRAAGGQPSVSLWVAVGRSVLLRKSYELQLMIISLKYFIFPGNTNKIRKHRQGSIRHIKDLKVSPNSATMHNIIVLFFAFMSAFCSVITDSTL